MQTITTDLVRPAERLSFWQETVCSGLVRVNCKATDGFSGDLRLGGSGRISVAELKASRHVVDRSQRTVAQDDDDCAMLFLQLDGTMGVVVDEIEYAVAPGSLFLYDMHSPIQLRFTDSFRHLAFRAPKHWFPDRPSSASSCLLASPSPMLRVAAAASAALFQDDSSPIDDDGSSAAIRAVINMLAETIGEILPLPDATPAERALTARFERLLYDHLQDASLTVEDLAGQMGVTPQYLNRVLTRSGGSVSKRILARRLQRCANELRLPRALRVSDIAFRWGFNDLSHFSRSFKAFYGLAPSDYRAAHCGSQAATD